MNRNENHSIYYDSIEIEIEFVDNFHAQLNTENSSTMRII